MNVADVIATDRVALVADVHSKKRALQRLAACLAEGVPYLTAGEIFNGLITREKLGSTGTGHGVAIPHTRVAGLDDCIGAMLRLSQPVDFAADDGQPVDLIFGLIVPDNCGAEHAQFLQALTRLLETPRCRAALRHAGDSKALADALIQHAAPQARSD